MSTTLSTCCGEQGCTASPERPCLCDCHLRDDVLRHVSDLSTVPCRRCGAPEGHSRHLFQFCEYSPHDPRCIRLTGAPDVREFCDCRVWQMLDAVCSCGKPFPEDGGAEGVCECCSGCAAVPVRCSRCQILMVPWDDKGSVVCSSCGRVAAGGAS